MKRGRFAMAAAGTAALAATAWLLASTRADYLANASLAERMAALAQRTTQPSAECKVTGRPRPLVLLALGQSNAANHGSLGIAAAGTITQFQSGSCFRSIDPLPGATGVGGSIWSHVPKELAALSFGRSVIFAVLAVDATRVDDWTRPRSPLRERLLQELHLMVKQDLVPDLVLWQQGEADARAGTSVSSYSESLLDLKRLLEQAGVQAPMLLAYSTVCRSKPSDAIRSAVDVVLTRHAGTQRGPDTDTLDGPQYRHDACHFSAQGLEAAARMWATQLRTAAPVWPSGS